jgi:hypothetical protein
MAVSTNRRSNPNPDSILDACILRQAKSRRAPTQSQLEQLEPFSKDTSSLQHHKTHQNVVLTIEKRR